MSGKEAGNSSGWPAALAILPLILLGLALAWFSYLPNSAGRIGADYSVWLPTLLAGFYWHIQNGVFSVPWFNPAQCGGVPVQADPQGAFFSLAQFLIFLLPPLRALRVSFLAYAAMGYAGCFQLARCFRLSTAASVLAAMLFAFNTLYPARMVVGHLSFPPFMLLPAAAACLIGESRSMSGWVIRCCCFGLLLAAMVEGGMLVLLPPCYLSLLMVIALHAVVARQNSLAPLGRLAACTLLGLLLSAGKLAAVLSLMAHIPRDAYKLPGYLNIGETLWVALRALFIGPANDMQTHLANASVLFERHEFEYSVGPAALVLLLAFAVVSWRRRAWPALPQRLAMDALLLLLLVPLAVNTFNETWTGLLKTLPIIRNSSSLLRWFAAYILPVVILCGVALDRLSDLGREDGNTAKEARSSFLKKRTKKLLFLKPFSTDRGTRRRIKSFLLLFFKKEVLAFARPTRLAWGRAATAWLITGAAGIVTLATLLLTDRGAYGPADIGAYDPATIEAAWHEAATTGHVPPVSEIAALRDANGQIDKRSLLRQNVMAAGKSQLFCYDPLFGYHLESFPQGTLHPGSVFDRTAAGPGGTQVLNIKNPACYVFPGANACKPGDAFTAAEIDQATRFVSYRPFTWRKPIWARAADWAGYVLWPATIVALLAALTAKLIRRPRAA